MLYDRTAQIILDYNISTSSNSPIPTQHKIESGSRPNYNQIIKIIFGNISKVEKKKVSSMKINVTRGSRFTESRELLSLGGLLLYYYNYIFGGALQLVVVLVFNLHCSREMSLFLNTWYLIVSRSSQNETQIKVTRAKHRVRKLDLLWLDLLWKSKQNSMLRCQGQLLQIILLLGLQKKSFYIGVDL